MLRTISGQFLRSNVLRGIMQLSPARYLFYEKDDRGGYYDTRPPRPKMEVLREGFKELKHEVILWSKEMKEHFEDDPILVYRPGETDLMWQFNERNIGDWEATSDSDNNEGYSNCSFALNKLGHAMFSGNLTTRVPKDGRVKRSGYCNVKSLPARKSFKRETYLDWTPYNILVMKVRGDGRSYLLNIATKGYFDVFWFDVYHYALYTRGGPYWQIARFFLSSKGRVQDRQYPLHRNRVTSFGISMGDKINGPFSLEIDYIGLENDPNHVEEFAYEMYKQDDYIVAT